MLFNPFVIHCPFVLFVFIVEIIITKLLKIFTWTIWNFRDCEQKICQTISYIFKKKMENKILKQNQLSNDGLSKLWGYSDFKLLLLLILLL